MKKLKEFQFSPTVIIFTSTFFAVVLFAQGCTFETQTWNRDPSWSPDSTKIVFDSDRDGDYSEIYSMNVDGSNQVQLTKGDKGSWSPAYSPEGNKIVYAYGYTPVPAPTISSIYCIDTDGSNPKKITDAESYTSWSQSDTNPAWSPDGQMIAFESTRNGGNQIFIMKADGTNQIALTSEEYFSYDPAWSPNGTKILFSARGEYPPAQIYVIDTDGSQMASLTNSNFSNWEPSWSPDGNRIVFSSSRDENFEIYIMDADGSRQTRLTNNHENDGAPVWSPDGSKIAFESDRGGTTEIYIMNIDGSNQTRLTGNSPLLSLGNLYLVALLITIVLSLTLPLRRRRLSGLSKRSEFAVVSLVTGITGALGSPAILCGFAMPLADLLSIIFGVLAIRQTEKNHNIGGRGIAITGTIIGAAGFLLVIAITIVYVIRSLKYLGLHY